MSNDARSYNVFIYLYNKNTIEYAKYFVTSGRFMIFHIEGYSNGLLFRKQVPLSWQISKVIFHSNSAVFKLLVLYNLFKIFVFVD